MINKFKEVFEELSRTYENTIVFNDFLDYTIDQFLINPEKDRLFSYNNYTEKDYELFFELFSCLVQAMEEKLKTAAWFDIIGYFYEEVVQSEFKGKDMGQFYTPISVTNLLSELATNNEEITQDKNDIHFAYDPAGGSGRTLLAHHNKRPYDLCFSADLDSTSVKMCVINFILHGVKGSVAHMDSLEMKFYDGFKVNEFIDYGTPMSVQRCNSLKECYVFTGVKSNAPKEIVTKTPDKVTVNSEPVTEKATGQTTLL